MSAWAYTFRRFTSSTIRTILSVGYFSADRFDPPKWKPRVPNPAFRRARPDDTFWAARRVMAFTDDMIRAAVKTGRYSDAAAEKHIADTLIARRDAIGRSWLTDVNPVIDPALDASGALTFKNAAVAAGVAKTAGLLRGRVVYVRQRDGGSTPIGQPIDSPREGGDCAVRPADSRGCIRASRHQGDGCRASIVGDPGARLLPAHRSGLEAGGIRTAAESARR